MSVIYKPKGWANRLKYAREKIGYSIADASKESVIPQADIEDFESGAKEPLFSQLVKLADVYKKDVGFFLTDKPIVDEIFLFTL